MQLRSQRHFTLADYLDIEEHSQIKHEYCNGEIFAMAGASLQHNHITSNVHAHLRRALRGTGCNAFGSDLRIATPGGLYTYPDVSVIYGKVELTVDRLGSATNPVVLPLPRHPDAARVRPDRPGASPHRVLPQAAGWFVDPGYVP